MWHNCPHAIHQITVHNKLQQFPSGGVLNMRNMEVCKYYRSIRGENSNEVLFKKPNMVGQHHACVKLFYVHM